MFASKRTLGKPSYTDVNTNIFAFYGKLGDGGQVSSIQSIIDNAWNTAARNVTSENAAGALNSIQIENEPYSESGSRNTFATIARQFIADGLDETSFVDKDGDRWNLDEYGDRSYMWDYM